jgi:hypothetical protein
MRSTSAVPRVISQLENIFRMHHPTRNNYCKNSQNITFKCSFKQCRSLKFLNKDNKLILLFSYVQKRSFQMCTCVLIYTKYYPLIIVLTATRNTNTYVFCFSIHHTLFIDTNFRTPYTKIYLLISSIGVKIV